MIVPGHYMTEVYSSQGLINQSVEFVCECGWKLETTPASTDWFKYNQAFHAAISHLANQVLDKPK